MFSTNAAHYTPVVWTHLLRLIEDKAAPGRHFPEPPSQYAREPYTLGRRAFSVLNSLPAKLRLIN